MVAFDSQVIQYLVIPSGATTGARIVLDGINGVILLYDNNNHLIASIAPNGGTDTTGQVYQAGFTSYEGLARQIFTEVFNGGLQLNTINAGTPAFVETSFSSGTHNDQLSIDMESPCFSNNPPNQPKSTASIFLFSANNAGTEAPYASIGMNGFNPADMDFIVQGVLKYGAPGNPQNVAPETWHNVSFGANWSNAGAPFDNVQYMRDAMGRVCLRGVAVFTGTDTAPSFVFTLPVGYRPAKDQLITSSNAPSADSTDAQTRNIRVFSATDGTNPGLVTTTNFSGTINPGPVSFDGVSFFL